MPDCGDNSCLYAKKKGGMRTNGGCRCDQCPKCGGRSIGTPRPHSGRGHIRANRTIKHYSWCPNQDWIPEHLIED